MSDDDNDIFEASSDDTDELLASSKSKPVATKKKSAGGRLKKKNTSIPDADDGSDDEANGLFDSDEEGEEETTKKRLKQKSSSSKTKSSSSSPPTKKLSKRERMEALQAKKRAQMNDESTSDARSKNKNKKKKDARSSEAGGAASADGSGYASGDSYDSAQYVRTKEDDDFIDTQGEDEDAVREYYAEQHFEDERPDELEEMEEKPRKKGRKGSSSSKKRGPDQLSAEDLKDKTNPISMAVERMKKKKKVVESFEKLKDTAVELVEKMQTAAREDELSLRDKKPGLKKLKMLPEVLDAMIKREMIRPLLEADFLIVAKKWIEPLKDGTLGNLTLRQKMIDGISKMNGDTGIDNDDLKRSDFGKLVMKLYTHKKETPEMKRKLKTLIEQWSRRIFRKSGDMRNLGASRAHIRSNEGLVGIAKAQAMEDSHEERSAQLQNANRNNNRDLGSILTNGVKQRNDGGRNRVRVPYSKGFQFTIRPENKTGDVTDKKNRTVNDHREALHKKMLDKKRRR